MTTPPHDEFEREVAAAKRASTAQLLFRCARLLNDEAIDRLRDHTQQPNLRAAHTALFPHLDLGGTRLTEVARRMGISKQAVGQLVNDMVAMGWLERIPDPADGRAKLIRFSTQEGSSILDGLAFLRDLERDVAEHLGIDDMQALHDILVRLDDLLSRWQADP